MTEQEIQEKRNKLVSLVRQKLQTEADIRELEKKIRALESQQHQ